MALKKTKELPSGVTGEYWKVTGIYVDREKLTLTATISLFKDKAASDAGKSNLGICGTFSKVFTKEELMNDVVPMAYLMVKELANDPRPSIFRGINASCNDLKNAIDA